MKEVWSLQEVKLPSVSLPSVSSEMPPVAGWGFIPPHRLPRSLCLILSLSFLLACLRGVSQLARRQLELRLRLPDWNEKYIKVPSTTQSNSPCTCTQGGYSLACCRWSRRDSAFFSNSLFHKISEKINRKTYSWYKWIILLINKCCCVCTEWLQLNEYALTDFLF